MTGHGTAGHSIGVTLPTADPKPLLEEPLETAALPQRPVIPPFDDVYDEYFPFVWRCLRRLGVAEPALDDAVQDVFVVVHRRLPDFEGRSSLKTWLFGVVLRVGRAHRRAVQRRGGLETLPPDLPDPAASPDRVLEAREALGLLDELLGRLDDDKRAVFVMAEVEEMSATEIAEVLRIPVNTVYSRLHAARRLVEAMAARRSGGKP